MRTLWFCFVLSIGLLSSLQAQETDKVYSGPQANEPLPSFALHRLNGSEAGRVVETKTLLENQPCLLIFIHDVNRQSISFARTLSSYAYTSRSKLRTCVILLQSDINEGETLFKRMGHALHSETPTFVSVDGKEGPGSLGLNRKVTLTLLVGNKSEVQANFALIQPSLQTDLLPIANAIVDVIGGERADLAKLLADHSNPRGMESATNSSTVDIRTLLRPLIQKDAQEADVIAIAKQIEAAAEKDDAVRREIARISKTIIDAGKLEQYGTPKAQEYLQTWHRRWNLENKP